MERFFSCHKIIYFINYFSEHLSSSTVFRSVCVAHFFFFCVIFYYFFFCSSLFGLPPPLFTDSDCSFLIFNLFVCGKDLWGLVHNSYKIYYEAIFFSNIHFTINWFSSLLTMSLQDKGYCRSLLHKGLNNKLITKNGISNIGIAVVYFLYTFKIK